MKIALVSGANRGLGLEVSRQLTERGVTVLGATRQSDVRLPYGPTFRMDVDDPKSIESAVREIQLSYPRIDIVINNAGIILDKMESVLTLSAETLNKTLTTNLYGPLRVSQAIFPMLLPGGRIINLSSLCGQLSVMDDWAPAYSIAKTALNALTVQLSIPGAQKGIAINCMCPGWCKTDMGGKDAPRSPVVGAADIVWLALDAPQALTGKFFRDRQISPW
jgi:NAD(P)-dependent dehydrogenase (short-subunit alcohol dehydrogenase family)